jgi:hypothetical protein
MNTELVSEFFGLDTASDPGLSLPTWRASSVQVCGLWPFAVGGNAPLVGAPLGRRLDAPGALCADPLSWFEMKIIAAPSSMVIALNGLGKSSLVRRMALCHDAFGIRTMVLGDIKPDYVDVIEALGGQVIRIGHGKTGINPLDAGNVEEALELLPPGDPNRAALLGAAHERKKNLVASLIQIIRRRPPEDREETILDEAIRELERKGGTPTLADLLTVIRNPTEAIRAAALDRGDLDQYMRVTEDLEASLMSLLSGRFGGIFAVERTTPMLMDRSVVFDVHDLLQAETDLQAAVLLACWSYGFATVEIAQALADAHLMPRQRYHIVMDELWRILSASSGMVARIDALTRLNRSIGVGQTMITHSIADLTSLESEADRTRAMGFIERAKMLFFGGLPRREMDLIEQIMHMSDAERELLSSWNSAASWDPSNLTQARPVGLGKFLMKTSDAPGIPFQVAFVEGEEILSDTNKRWHKDVQNA